MILVIDNNNIRGTNISSILQKNKCKSIHYKFVTGDTEKNGDWDELKIYFENLIRDNTILFIHKNNARSEDAAKLFLEKSTSNQVIFYSGGGNFITQIQNKNCFAFQGRVSDDAKAEWDLLGFTGELLGINNNLVEALMGTDEIIERLLKTFVDKLPLEENWKGTDLFIAKEYLIKEANKKL